MRAAREAIDAAGGDTLLVGRAEELPASAGPISTTPSAGLQAYAKAGADCLYAPGIRTRDEIAAVVAGGRAEAGQPADGLAPAS